MIPADPVKWAITAFRDDRSRDYRVYLDYYQGKHVVTVPSDVADPWLYLLRGATYNRCDSVVDSIADRLTITGFRQANGSGTVQPADDLWRVNRMDKGEGEVNQEALMSGDAYAIVWPDFETGVPTIFPQVAAELRVLYDDERRNRIVLAAKLWTTDEGYVRLNIYHADRLEKYVTTSKVRSGVPGSPGAFTRYQEPNIDLAWPLRYGWFVEQRPNIPVFHFANNARTGRYGYSELRNVIPLQDDINAAVRKLLLGAELSADRQKWATGIALDPARPVRLGVDRIVGTDIPDARFGTFDATDLNQFIGTINQFDLMIARTARVPIHHIVPSGTFPSGESLKTAESPFVAKVKDRQVAFGNVWEDLMTLALRMQGMSTTAELEAVYEPAAPRSDTERATLAVAYHTAGFPLAAICRMIDLSQEDIDLIIEEQDAAVERARAAFDAGEQQFGNEDTAAEDAA